MTSTFSEFALLPFNICPLPVDNPHCFPQRTAVSWNDRDKGQRLSSWTSSLFQRTQLVLITIQLPFQLLFLLLTSHLRLSFGFFELSTAQSCRDFFSLEMSFISPLPPHFYHLLMLCFCRFIYFYSLIPGSTLPVVILDTVTKFIFLKSFFDWVILQFPILLSSYKEFSSTLPSTPRSPSLLLSLFP